MGINKSLFYLLMARDRKYEVKHNYCTTFNDFSANQNSDQIYLFAFSSKHVIGILD